MSERPIVEQHRTDLLTCPFCNDKDFDAIGLKFHLLHGCENFDAVPMLRSVYG